MREGARIAVMPLAARRIDDEQGVWGRQLAARLASELERSGVDITFAPLVGESDEGPAFVHDEAYPDAETIARRLAGTDFTHVIAGELRIEEEVARIGAALHAIGEDRHEAEFMQERPGAEVFDLFEDLVRHFARALGVPAPERPALLRQTRSVDALRLFLADQDVALHASMAGPRPGERLAERWRFLREAAARDPGFVHAQGLYVQRAIAAARGGQVDEALEALDELDAHLGGPNAERLGARAEVCTAAKRFEAAEEALRAALALQPDFAWAAYRLGYLRLLVDDYAGAAQWLRHGHEAEPQNPHIRAFLAVSLAELGESAEAQALWESVRLDPQAPAQLQELAGASARFADARDRLAAGEADEAGEESL